MYPVIRHSSPLLLWDRHIYMRTFKLFFHSQQEVIVLRSRLWCKISVLSLNDWQSSFYILKNILPIANIIPYIVLAFPPFLSYYHKSLAFCSLWSVKNWRHYLQEIRRYKSVWKVILCQLTVEIEFLNTENLNVFCHRTSFKVIYLLCFSFLDAKRKQN